MTNNKNERSSLSEEEQHGAQESGRPLFSMTINPHAIERELDHVAHELHSTVSSMLGAMHSSVFGGLESLVQHLEDQHRQMPWTIRPWGTTITDGSTSGRATAAAGAPKKRYRITIEEIPVGPTADDSSSSSMVEFYQRRHQDVVEDAQRHDSVVLAHQVDASGNELSIQQGKRGTQEEGKTVITTTCIAPGLLDWLLFTTHEDSFFRRLGQAAAAAVPSDQKLEVLEEKPATPSATTPDAAAKAESAPQRPALVEKVKQLGTHWEQEARDWWPWRHDHVDNEEDEDRHRPFWLRRDNRVLAGSGLDEDDQEPADRRRPRWRSWGRQESFSQTTVTRPDGTIETKSVSSLNGETETRIKLVRPDGTVEETVTRDRGNGWGNRRHHHQHPHDHTFSHEHIGSMVEEEKYQQQQQQHHTSNSRHNTQAEEEQQQQSSRSWPPKAWLRRQAQEQERDV